MLPVSLLALALSLCLVGCGTYDQATSGQILVRLPKALFNQFNLQPDKFHQDHYQNTNHIVGFMDSHSYSDSLSQFGPRIEKLDPLLWAAGAYLEDSAVPQFEKTLPEMKEGYHDYQQLSAELTSLAEQNPGILRLETAGKSRQGRELWYVVMSDNVTVDEPEPKFIYHANMHGDEVVGRELMIYLIRHFLEQYSADRRITHLVNNAQIFIMPSMNPDGFELGTRGDSQGIDLNRRFPDRFTSANDVPDGRPIEIQHMMNLALRNHFVYGINWHGGEICFNLPWGNIRNLTANKYWDDAMFYPIGREYTKFNQPMFTNHYDNFDHGLTYGYEWYPVNGGINDWFNFYRRSIHAVVELSKVKWPSPSELPKFWDDNREAMIRFLWQGLRGLHLEVRDQNGTLITRPRVTVNSTPGRAIVFDQGFVHRLTGEGMQAVTIAADGYQPVTIDLESRFFAGEFTAVVLPKEILRP